MRTRLKRVFSKEMYEVAWFFKENLYKPSSINSKILCLFCQAGKMEQTDRILSFLIVLKGGLHNIIFTETSDSTFTLILGNLIRRRFLRAEFTVYSLSLFCRN